MSNRICTVVVRIGIPCCCEWFVLHSISETLGSFRARREHEALLWCWEVCTFPHLELCPVLQSCASTGSWCCRCLAAAASCSLIGSKPSSAGAGCLPTNSRERCVLLLSFASVPMVTWVGLFSLLIDCCSTPANRRLEPTKRVARGWQIERRSRQ